VVKEVKVARKDLLNNKYSIYNCHASQSKG
jgi:hypothetical protein